MFETVLVANRGEIAIRIIRTLREMGIRSVAVYSEADRDALFVQYADEAHFIGPAPAAESYLDVTRILDAARASGADAIHPGYGFLAENAGFARACEGAGITFIGPPADAIDAMGSKTAARRLMEAAGVPIVPGVTEAVADVAEALGIAEAIGYPVAVKAAAGGGGKGFRVALTPDALEGAFEGARRESEKFFADSTVYLERYLPDPRHVEIQILADGHGTTLWLGERDCSVQRRHQKLVEETPSPVVSDALRQRMGEASVRAAEAVGYRSAGTLEYLVSGEDFFFLEMNTRIQVEHTITEMVTGIDLVREQVRIAAGEALGMTQADVAPRGHAFECRINAEDAERRFLPTPGRITAYREPAGPGIRMDSGVQAGSVVSDMYDPMVAKLIVWDTDRESARMRMLRALDEFVVEGITTLIPFHQWLLREPAFIDGGACHAAMTAMTEANTPLPVRHGAPAPAPGSPDNPPMVERRLTAEVAGRRFDVRLFIPESDLGPAGPTATPRRVRTAASGGHTHAVGGVGAAGTVCSPMQGTVLSVAVVAGQSVAVGDVICIIEAMKMENEVTACTSGTISAVNVAAGQAVTTDEVLAVIG
ncbi:MAG: acetyl-CoA carboxylase biotin carboxylase subunit [Thermoleophilia bacterium]|nr:acetyl-CoA carboxylase biotin carboxylase subunit [Thermoleophilia bacterium]